MFFDFPTKIAIIWSATNPSRYLLSKGKNTKEYGWTEQQCRVFIENNDSMLIWMRSGGGQHPPASA
jgi:hypothetical protein